MDALLAAHADVGGDVVSAGGTGTYDLNTWVTEIQAGSYALMDTAVRPPGPRPSGQPFGAGARVLGTVISVQPAVGRGDVGLKALGMDHGNPSDRRRDGAGSARTSTSPSPPTTRRRRAVGDRVRVRPAHVDPTDRLPRAAARGRRRRRARRLARRPPRLVTAGASHGQTRGVVRLRTSPPDRPCHPVGAADDVGQVNRKRWPAPSGGRTAAGVARLVHLGGEPEP